MWTSEAPARPGWYFWRARAGAELVPCRVQVPAYLGATGPLLVERFYLCAGTKAADLFDGGEWWRMPVQPPEVA